VDDTELPGTAAAGGTILPLLTSKPVVLVAVGHLVREPLLHRAVLAERHDLLRPAPEQSQQIKPVPEVL